MNSNSLKGYMMTFRRENLQKCVTKIMFFKSAPRKKHLKGEAFLQKTTVTGKFRMTD